MLKEMPTARLPNKQPTEPKPEEPESYLLCALSAIASFSLNGEKVDGGVYKMTTIDAFMSIECVVNIARDVLVELEEKSCRT